MAVLALIAQAGGALVAAVALFAGHVTSRLMPLFVIHTMTHVGDTPQSKSKPLAESIGRGALAVGVLWWGLQTDRHLIPFLAALGLFVLSYAGIGISFYPYIVPGALTIEEAAAPDSSLGFLLVGAAVLVPIILIYTGYAYWVFRGKIDPEEGYH